MRPTLATEDRVILDVDIDAGLALDLGFGTTLALTGLVVVVAGALRFLVKMSVLSSAIFSSVTGPSIEVRLWLLMHWTTREKSSAAASAPEATPHHLNAIATRRSPFAPGPRR